MGRSVNPTPACLLRPRPTRFPNPAWTLHQTWLDGALPHWQGDERFLGVAAAGSWLRDELDAWSDLDLVLCVRPDAIDAVMAERATMAATLGPLLTHFTGEHVGEPRLLICLYGPPLLHVDLKFITPEQGADRVEDPAIRSSRGPEMRPR